MRRWQRAILAALDSGLAQLGDGTLPMARRVQKARQATKAARALLRLAPPALSRQALGVRMVLGSARRLLSQTRDTDALIETLDQLLPVANIGKASGATLRKLLLQRRAGHNADLPQDVERTRMLLQRALKQVAAFPVSKTGEKAIRTAIVRDYKRMRRDCLKAFAGDDIEALHDLRKRVVVHRHHCAFVASVGDEKLWERRAGRAKALHEALGNHRDLALLDGFLRPLQMPKLTPAIAKLLREIGKQQDTLLGEGHGLSRKLNRRRPRRFRAELADTLTL